MYSLLDAGERAAMPLHVKLIDVGSILAGIALGAGTGYYLWKQMNRILRQEEAAMNVADEEEAGYRWEGRSTLSRDDLEG